MMRAYIDFREWALPLSLLIGRGGLEVRVLCFGVEVEW